MQKTAWYSYSSHDISSIIFSRGKDRNSLTLSVSHFSKNNNHNLYNIYVDIDNYKEL